MPKNHQKLPVNDGPHLPVMLHEMLDLLDPQKGESYLDLTAGYGGHAAAVLDKTKNPKGAVLVDRDARAVEFLRIKFAVQPITMLKKDFLSACQALTDEGRQFDMILADLGTSSPHLNQAERGFSIKLSGPLDMRMDQSQELSALTIVNKWHEAEIAKILRDFGQEPKARAIAKQIIAARPLATTEELANIVKRSWRGFSRLHPATRTFQALRIAVNNELMQLERSLPLMTKLLAPAGRMVVISFHSLEDRIVKQFLSENASNTLDAELRALTKKPLAPSNDEIASNPRARSAKLRAAVKIKTKRKE
jgi:16S rRNA (cytosine1402-N4)-methyltransferase